ncbi:MAG: class I adenylate-forming enzyme family protein [Pseudomonadota bacterium]
MTGMTEVEAAEHLIRSDPRFALAERAIRGVDYRVFANAPSSLREMMRVSAQAHGDRDFLVFEGERLTYGAFCERTNKLAHRLLDMGVHKGDRVAAAMRNYPEILILMMAVASIGAIFVPVNAWWTTEELQYGFEDSGAKISFVDGPRLERIARFAPKLDIHVIGVRDAEDDAPERFTDLLAGLTNSSWPTVEIDPDDDFAVMYSSGSTGHPKGVVQTHRGAISAVYSWIFAGDLARLVADPDGPLPGADVANGTSKALVVTPLFHVTASHAIWLQCLALGTSVVLMHKWDADAAIDLINREQVTRLFGVPTQCADLTLAQQARGVAMPSLALLGAGGAKRPPVQVGQQAEAFPNAAIATGWGMTETNALGLTMSGADYVERPGAAGRCIPPLQDMRIVNEAGRDVPTGEIGELLVKSPANMRCYLNRPEDTDEVLKDGWLHTGDLARLDEDRYYSIVDRKKSIIIRGGENISALEVEAAIHRHPEVLEAGVFPVPDNRLGETVGAGVQLQPGSKISAEDLRSFLSEHIARFKLPTHIWFRADPLPRGATDKIDRRVLRRECLARLTSETAAG